MLHVRRIFTQLSIIIVLAFFSVLAIPQTSYAACSGATSGSSGKVLEGVGDTGPCTDNGVDRIVKAAVEILSFVAGAVAVIMVIVAGFKYMTSGGDSGKVSSAKNTLIYAMVGLAIAVLAQALVHFVLSKSNSVTYFTPPGSISDLI